MTTHRDLEFRLATEDDTARLARALADLARPGDVLALYGDLGAGKTTFSRNFIQARGGGEVPSPTFTLVQSYDLPGGRIDHFDLFRIEHPVDVVELGLEDSLVDGICLIEWPEKLGPYIPEVRLDLYLEIVDGTDQRLARLNGGGSWQHRLEGLVLHV